MKLIKVINSVDRLLVGVSMRLKRTEQKKLRIVCAGSKLQYSKSMLYALVLVTIILAKILRWTVLKETVADASIGYSILNSMSADYSFTIGRNTNNNFYWFYGLFKWLPINTFEVYELLITILGNGILLWMIKGLPAKTKTFECIMICLSVAAINIFALTLSKEPIQFIFFLLIAACLDKDNITTLQKIVLSSLLLIVSALSFRIYFLFIFAFFAELSIPYLYIIQKRKQFGRSKQVMGIIGLFLLLSISYLIMLKVIKLISPSAYVELFRVRTRANVNDVNTFMYNLFPVTGELSLVLNCFIYCFRFLFPIELVGRGMKYLLFICYQLCMTGYWFSGGVKRQQEKQLRDCEWLAFFLYVAFTMVIAIFEYDFGSWVRHESVLMPLMLVCMKNQKITCGRKGEVEQ